MGWPVTVGDRKPRASSSDPGDVSRLSYAAHSGVRPASPPRDGTVSMATVSVQGEACAAPIRTQLADIAPGRR
jgi:hypothetical protein